MQVSRRQFASAALSSAVLGAAAIPSGAESRSRFVRAQGKDLVGLDGQRLILRGINLGNWLEPEGYMFLFEQGPASPHEIEQFVDELVGPTSAAQFPPPSETPASRHNGTG